MMEKLKSYRDLKVWQKSMELTEEIYLITEKFPKSQVYGLTSQIRRAAVSIPANIAEGQARHTTQQFLQFLGIAKGSTAELETLSILSKALKYISEIDLNKILLISSEINKMLHGLSKALTEKEIGQK